MTGRFGPITLHDEITSILREHTNSWMTTTELATEVNRRGVYRKRDGSAVTPFQIQRRTFNYHDMFERDGSHVRLRAPSSASEHPSMKAPEPPTQRPAKHVAPAQPDLTAELVGVLAALRRPLLDPVAAAGQVPPLPGLYAFHGTAAVWRQLGLGAPPDGRPLYVGKSESSLLARDMGQHFQVGSTGSSTLRRSLAALLSDELRLRAMPRNPAKPGYFSNYGLEPEGDACLSVWMRANLRLAVWPARSATSLGAIERQAIHRLLPPLNLQGVSTPWKAFVSGRRRRLADEARDWRP